MKRALCSTGLALALAVTGCGGGSDRHAGGEGGNPSMASSATPGTGKMLDIGMTDVGRAVVDDHGRTLYLFTRDTATKSNCSGACAQEWPPALVGRASKTAAGIDRREVGSIKRSDGSRQLTYAGHPLYFFTGDGELGDATGAGSTAFGGKWYAVAPSGKPLRGASNDGSGGSGGGYGY